jgi:hypothetical protein
MSAVPHPEGKTRLSRIPDRKTAFRSHNSAFSARDTVTTQRTREVKILAIIFANYFPKLISIGFHLSDLEKIKISWLNL